MTEATAESDEIIRQSSNMKKKTARVQAEMEDLKLLLEEEQSRNAELEKKQRRYNNNCTFKLNSGLEKKVLAVSAKFSSRYKVN